MSIDQTAKKPVILLAGMPRAGTTWFFYLLTDLWKTAGGEDARDLRSAYHLERYMSRGSANIATVLPDMYKVLGPYRQGHTYVLKTHDSPAVHRKRLLSQIVMRRLIDRGIFKPLYIYRDPRDAILSAYEYGIRRKESGNPNMFSVKVQSIDMGINWMAVEPLVNMNYWRNMPGIYVTSYEDLTANYFERTAKVIDYLGLDNDSEAVQAVIQKYRPGVRAGESPVGMHFYKGVAGRFNEVFSESQKTCCKERFGEVLEELGYPLE